MFGFERRVIKNLNDRERADVEALLERQGLVFEGKPDCTVIIEDSSENIAATASIEGNIIKMVAADAQWQEAGLSGLAVSAVLQYARENNIFHLFIYTKPEMASKFESLGFSELARSDSAALMESGQPSAREYKKTLEASRFENVTPPYGAAVMNCNPFTLGHRYLIESASRRCCGLYIIAVEENLSAFPFSDRVELIRAGTSDLPNVKIIPSAEYAVSRATFPSYFLKDTELDSVSAVQAELDATLFANLFVPALSLTMRFVGTEPFCTTTDIYNAAMVRTLPARGVEVITVPRLNDASGIPVSASRARAAIKKGEEGILRELLPQTTLDYLASAKGRAVAAMIRAEK